MSSAVTRAPSAMIAARLMQLSSSRTLPGQACASMARMASSLKRQVAAPLLLRKAAQEGVRQQHGVAVALAQRRDR